MSAVFALDLPLDVVRKLNVAPHAGFTVEFSFSGFNRDVKQLTEMKFTFL